MSFIPIRIGNIEAYIETAAISTMEIEGRATRETGLKVPVAVLFDTVTDAVREIASQFGGSLAQLAGDMAPASIEIELAIGVTGQAGICILSQKADCSAKVKLIWKKTSDDGK